MELKRQVSEHKRLKKDIKMVRSESSVVVFPPIVKQEAIDLDCPPKALGSLERFKVKVWRVWQSRSLRGA